MKKQVRDINSKIIFQDPLLCCQFLKDYLDIPILKDITPEDIEDVSNQYQEYLGTEFEADSVKRIKIRATEIEQNRVKMEKDEFDSIFLVSLIEHKSTVDYNISIQLLKYMVCIWNEYGRELERKYPGITHTKSFRYPPVLPIVYYEGAGSWTVSRELTDRIWLPDIFSEYLPNFKYHLVAVHAYSNEELLSKEDEMSLLMMINKMQTVEDFHQFMNTEKEKMNLIIQQSPERIIQIIADTLWSLLRKINISQEEARECVKKVKERQMGYLFENMEKIDVQAERRNTREARKALEKKEQELEKQKEEVAKKNEDIKKKNKELNMVYNILIQKYEEQGKDCEQISLLLQQEWHLDKIRAEEIVKQFFVD